jgi:hypothetical protein
MNVAVRFALLCAATAGTSLLFVQLYKIPIDTGTVVMTSMFFSLFFNVVFVYLKFRYALPLFGLGAFLYVRGQVDEFLFNLGCLSDYVLLYIDSNVVQTAGFASRTPDAIFGSMSMPFHEGLQRGVIYLCIFFALLFALSARGKFIGSILITSIIVLIPSIASQKATYVPAMTILAASMLGLYSIWASQEGSFLKGYKPRKQKKGPFIPKIHRHSVNGAAAAFIALVSALLAQRMIPVERTQETIDFWGEAAANVVEFFYELGERIGSGFEGVGMAPLDTSGFMPSGSIHSPGSLSINSPTLSRRHVLNVILEHDREPVYLRNGIGATFNAATGRWDVGARANRMRGFSNNFYPEHEYLVFRQRATALGYREDELIGRQRVEVEYLVRTPHVMLPTAPYMPSYKSDSRFTWNHDAILEKRGSTQPQSYTWSVLYPLMRGELGLVLDETYEFIESENPLTEEQEQELRIRDFGGSPDDYLFMNFHTLRRTATGTRLPPSGALRIFTMEYGLTASEYQDSLRRYEEMVYDLYTTTVTSESDNMQRLLNEILAAERSFARLNDYEKAAYIEAYFKSRYSYSLVTNNNAGDNTMLGNFLFETRSGHCALYATAMALLLREQGIPARYVTGYVVGGGGASSGRRGSYLYEIQERDLHAWVEVYFRNIGWLPFDPTPPIYETHFLEAERARGDGAVTTTTPRTTPPNQTTTTPLTTTTTPFTTTTPRITTPGETTPPEITTTPEDEAVPREPIVLPMQLIMFIVIILLGGTLAASVAVFIRSVNRTERSRLAKYTEIDERNTAREAYRFMLRVLGIEGLSVQAGETPVKFAQRTDEIIQSAGIASVIDVIEKLEFSREELTAEEYGRLGVSVAGLYKRIVTDNKAFRRFIRRIIAMNIVK